jgi:hypothetical protein
MVDPLRHNATNLHIDEASADEVTLTSYLFVTEIRAGAPAALSSAVCRATARRAADGWRLARMEVVLDTTDSKPFSRR